MAAESAVPVTETWVEMCGRRIPRSVVCQILRLLDERSLSCMSSVSCTFRQMANDPSVFNFNTCYTGPATSLPSLQEAVPFPPPALVGTTLESITTVNTSPDFSTSIPAATAVFIPVLPETVPMFAQIPDVVKMPGENRVEISQVLPGYAPSYATDYIPTEVGSHSFSTFANTISFNVSRYPTLSDLNLKVVDSKGYNERKPVMTPAATEEGPQCLATEKSDARQGFVQAASKMEYVPAEYFRGEASWRGTPIVSLYSASRVDFVRPDVLASGRLLTNMTSKAMTTSNIEGLTITNSTATTVAEELTLVQSQELDEPLVQAQQSNGLD